MTTVSEKSYLFFMWVLYFDCNRIGVICVSVSLAQLIETLYNICIGRGLNPISYSLKKCEFLVTILIKKGII